MAVYKDNAKGRHLGNAKSNRPNGMGAANERST